MAMFMAIKVGKPVPEVSIAQARNSLTRLIQEAENGERVHITRRGKPVAVLMSRQEYERLESGATGSDFRQGIKTWREQTSFDWPELTRDEVDSWRDRRPPRESEWPD